MVKLSYEKNLVVFVNLTRIFLKKLFGKINGIMQVPSVNLIYSV